MTKTINGVDIKALADIIRAVEEDESLAPFQFRNRNRWIDGGHNQSTIQSYYGAGKEDDSRDQPFVLDNDEPEPLLGKNKGANPVEQVLHGLAGCVTTTFAYFARPRGSGRTRPRADQNRRSVRGAQGAITSSIALVKPAPEPRVRRAP